MTRWTLLGAPLLLASGFAALRTAARLENYPLLLLGMAAAVTGVMVAVGFRPKKRPSFSPKWVAAQT